MKILCVGLMVCDLIIKPVSADILKKDTQRADVIDVKIGGDACNVAYNLTNLGGNATLLSGIGDDFYGEFILNHLKANHVSTKQIIKIGKDTAKTAVLISESGERCFLSQKGACHKLSPCHISDEMLSAHDILFVGSAGDLPMLEGENLRILFERAKKLGVKTFLDVTGEVNEDFFQKIKGAMASLDVFLPSLREAKNMSGLKDEKCCLEFFQNAGAKTVVIKLGAKGSCGFLGGQLFIADGFNAPCVDTTGAGDSFVAGFIMAYSKGMDIFNCCKIGNFTGSKTVMEIGAQVKLPKFTEIIKEIGEQNELQSRKA